jgi:hypothetical protein
MAGRARTTAKPVTEGDVEQAPAEQSTDAFSFEVRESAEPIKHVRSEKPNPLAPAFKASLDTGKTLEIPVPNAEVAKVAVNHLRRAAKDSNVGLSVHYYEDAGVVRFRAKREKIQRKYTSDDIRKWARDNGIGDELLFPRIDPRVRAAFKDARNAGDDE